MKIRRIVFLFQRIHFYLFVFVDKLIRNDRLNRILIENIFKKKKKRREFKSFINV